MIFLWQNLGLGRCWIKRFITMTDASPVMTDIVERLEACSPLTIALAHEAAAEIKRLTNSLDKAHEAIVTLSLRAGRAEAAEARLAEAVEVVREAIGLLLRVRAYGGVEPQLDSEIIAILPCDCLTPCSDDKCSGWVRKDLYSSARAFLARSLGRTVTKTTRRWWTRPTRCSTSSRASPRRAGHERPQSIRRRHPRHRREAVNQTCRTCRWYSPGQSWPHTKKRGECLAIHDARAGDRDVVIEPAAIGAVLRVSADFGCKLHEELKP